MTDSSEGSSGAAQGARHQETGHPAEDEDSRGGLGFFHRFMEAFGTSDDDEADGEGEAAERHSEPSPGLLNLRRMRVEDVAIPKAEIVAVAEDIGFDELVGVFRESGMTRLPVFKGTLDTPLGLAHLKDFALQHGFNGGGDGFELRPLLRPLLYVPPSMPIGVLLQKMQSERMHMALVIDEYGGADGLVTIEDLIEQVIGEIEDEFDVAEDGMWLKEGPGAWLVQARAPLDEFETEIGARLVEPEDEEEVDSIGGLVFMLLGRVPARGEVVRHPHGHEIEVVDADPRRIKRLRVRLAPESD